MMNRRISTRLNVPVHHLNCTTTASGVQSVELLETALRWLAGSTAEIRTEKTTSYHGSNLHLLQMKLKRGSARMFLSRLGRGVLEVLLAETGERIDETRNLHFRLLQEELVCGVILIADGAEDSVVVKISVKLEVYAGDDVQEVARRLLSESLERSIRRGWGEGPPPP